MKAFRPFARRAPVNPPPTYPYPVRQPHVCGCRLVLDATSATPLSRHRPGCPARPT